MKNLQAKVEKEEKRQASEGENGREAFYCLSIIGQIEGHYTLEGNQKATKYDHLLPLLVSLEEDERIDGILILLNTMGGDVEAGLAISEVIASLDKPTVSVVLGGGHSIGVPLAVSARRSFIVPSATMTIHPVRTTGTVIAVPQSFDYLKQMQNRILDFVVSHSRVEREYLESIMMRTDMLANDVGSVIDGREAVACGLASSIRGGEADASVKTAVFEADNKAEAYRYAACVTNTIKSKMEKRIMAEDEDKKPETPETEETQAQAANTEAEETEKKPCGECGDDDKDKDEMAEAKAQIDALKAENAELKAELDKLKSTIARYQPSAKPSSAPAAKSDWLAMVRELNAKHLPELEYAKEYSALKQAHLAEFEAFMQAHAAR